MTLMHTRETSTPVAKFKHIVRIKKPIEGRAVTSFYADELATRYGFPVLTSLSTYGVCITELCDGYPALMSDVKAYCARRNLPVPPINLVGIDGASTNNPSMVGAPENTEVALDIQDAIGASRGMVPITVVFTQNSTQGFVNAIQWPAANPAANIAADSISWGQSEPGWPDPDRLSMDLGFENGNAAGVTYTASSGDDGSADGQATGNACDYPASSPFVIGCGGTTISGTSERAWSYGGGGYSAKYPRPSWQTTVGNPARMVPDVSLDGDPNSGHNIIVEGQWQVIGGTSAVSPMWAALIAIIATLKKTRFGFLNAALWSRASLFTDIVGGSNGAYQATAGPDPCTGLGIPNANLIAALVGDSTGPTPPVPPPPLPPPPVLGGKIIASIVATKHYPSGTRLNMKLPVAFGPSTLDIVEVPTPGSPHTAELTDGEG